MKTALNLLILLALAGCASFDSKDIRIPDYKIKNLKNGLQVISIVDKTLPKVSVGLLIRTGSSSDPVGKSGLADLTAQMIERGSQKLSATQIADQFGYYGSSFISDIDYDYSYFATYGLSQHQSELFNLFFDVVTTPAFSVGEVQRLKGEMIAEIKRSYDQHGFMAGKVFNQFLFGAHPYGRNSSGTVRDVASIKQKDMIRFYIKNYRPNNATLILVGDINEKFAKEFQQKLDSWEPRELENINLPPLRPLDSQRILLVNRSDLQQSEIRLGHYGIKRKIDDYQALMVAETILSSGFTSRLMKEIRDKRGLTYGISSSFDARKEIGPFTIATNTRHEKVGEVITETVNILKNFHEKGVTPQEVADAKGYLRGVFPRRIETSDQLAKMLVALKFYDIDESYLKNYLSLLDDVSVSDVNRAIKKYYQPNLLRVLIYGPKDKVIDQLRPIGAVEVKNYTELF